MRGYRDHRGTPLAVAYAPESSQRLQLDLTPCYKKVHRSGTHTKKIINLQKRLKRHGTPMVEHLPIVHGVLIGI